MKASTFRDPDAQRVTIEYLSGDKTPNKVTMTATHHPTPIPFRVVEVHEWISGGSQIKATAVDISFLEMLMADQAHDATMRAAFPGTFKMQDMLRASRKARLADD